MAVRYRARWPARAHGVGCDETIVLLGDVLEFDSPAEGLRQLQLAASSPRMSPSLKIALERGTVEFVPVPAE